MSDNEWVKPGVSMSSGPSADPINEEVQWDKTKTIMSETDKFGTITNVNETFVNVSGYSVQELIGKPHNIIRHPDMPQIIFKALWSNLEQGNNFIGVVKNKSKSGRYYWVVTDFEIIKDAQGNHHRYIARRRAVDPLVIENHIQPLYESLLKMEKVGGMELSNRYFKNFLEKQGKGYLDYIMEVLGENSANVTKTADVKMDDSHTNASQPHQVSDNIYDVDSNSNDEEKRKSFFSRLFS